MTDLYSGQIADLFQNDTKYNVEVQALAYAMRIEKRRLMDLAQKTRTLAMIDLLPEKVLNVLAVELRTPYYMEDMTIDQKRALIKNTLVWFYHAGTPAAVEELVATIFGEGKVVEWFDFTEPPFTPGTFDIITDARMTEDIVVRFLRIIGQVKNTRSHLRQVHTERQGAMQEYIGAGTISAPKTNIVNHAPARERTASGSVRIGAALAARNVHRIVLNRTPPGTAKTGQLQAAT